MELLNTLQVRQDRQGRRHEGAGPQRLHEHHPRGGPGAPPRRLHGGRVRVRAVLWGEPLLGVGGHLEGAAGNLFQNP